MADGVLALADVAHGARLRALARVPTALAGRQRWVLGVEPELVIGARPAGPRLPVRREGRQTLGRGIIAPVGDGRVHRLDAGQKVCAELAAAEPAHSRWASRALRI